MSSGSFCGKPPAQALRKLSRDEINALPLRAYDGPIHLITSHREWEAIEPGLRKASVLGFDTETQPSFRKGHVNPPALLQLAAEDAVYLIQLGAMPFAKECAAILANPAIIKAGVGIMDDMAELATTHPFLPAGCVDLGIAAEANGMSSHGLRNLAAALFGWRISKGCRCSNWGAEKLSARQLTYAATDAWLGRLLYLRMLELGMKGLEPCQ